MGSAGAAGNDGQAGERYRFGGIVVDAVAHTLRRDGQLQAVEPKAFAVLLVLLRHAGELVGREQLLDAVWGHRHVTPGVLTRAIAQLRTALDDDSQQPRFIQTQHALGYRFIGELWDEPPKNDGAALPKSAADGDPGPTAVAVADATTIATRQDVVDGRLPETQPDQPDLLQRQQPPVVPTRKLHWWLMAAILAGIAMVSWFGSRGPVAPALKPREASVAVLPFTNLSADRKDDYFAEGLAVEMHDALAGVQGLKVAALMSPSAAASRDADVKALGQRLGVATVLDASVRREGARVRINARLSNTATGYTLWSRTYDREMVDVFAMQREIANEVVRSLLGVLPAKDDALAKRLTPTTSAAAFDAYLRGQQLLRTDGDGNDERASVFFNQALAADGQFARAQAGICRSEVFRFEHERVAEAFEHARKACARAKALDPGLSEVSLALAKLYHAHGDLGAASEYYAKAEIDPARRPDVYVGLALLHGEQGRHAQALDYLRRALESNPGNPVIHSYSGYYHYLAGDLRRSIVSYRKAIELEPGNEDYWSTLGAIYVDAGDNAAGTRALEKSIEIKPSYAALSNLGEIKYQAAEYAEAADLYRRATALEPADYVPWGNLGNALLADAKTANEARAAFQKAAERAQQYVEIKSNDATALAGLGWFRANLGQAAQARELVRRSETLRGESMEIALFNAQTLAMLGEIDQARQRVAAARAAGLPETRIATNVVLRRAGIVSAPPVSKSTASPAPSDAEGHPPGE